MFVDRVMFRILVAIVNHAHEPHQEGASINHVVIEGGMGQQKLTFLLRYYAVIRFTIEKGTLGENGSEFSNMVTITLKLTKSETIFIWSKITFLPQNEVDFLLKKGKSQNIFTNKILSPEFHPVL